MPTLEEKKVYFNQYWQNQPTDLTDPRTIQRARHISELLEKKGGRLLDVGCGRGITIEFFKGRGYDVTGADISPDMIAMAQERGYRAFLLDLEKDNIRGRYEVILCLEVLQQLYDPLSALTKLNDSLTEEGELAVSIPNEFHIVSRLGVLFGKSHLGHYDHSHIRLFSPRRGEDLFFRAGLRIVKERHISIAPPRWKVLSAIMGPLTRLFPSLLAISSTYILKKNEA
jgi:SAM-dependent methyltransferase